MKQSVVVLGKGTLAIRVADWFLQSPAYELAHIVPVIPEPCWTDSLAGWAKTKGISIVASGHFKDLEKALPDGGTLDLGISVFYDKIIKPSFISRCRRILNIHNAPLPRYRGVSPINWALKNGESKHGVTIHEITPGIDDGPIVSQLEYSIYPAFDEVCEVYQRSLEYAWVLFKETMPLLDRISATPQDESAASYYSAKQNPLLGERRGFTRLESEAAKLATE